MTIFDIIIVSVVCGIFLLYSLFSLVQGHKEWKLREQIRKENEVKDG